MAKAKSAGLLLHHLEDLSWKVLEEYPEVVRELIRRRAGVYALYYRKKLYYVGLASNLMGRLKQHLKDRHHGEWDRFSVYLTSADSHMKELESLLLRIAKPEGNRVKGGFSGSKNLYADLSRRVKEFEADRLATLLGGAFAKRRRKTKAKRGKGDAALRGITERRVPLRGAYKGNAFRASLRKDGCIYMNGRRFKSPSAAARVITKRPTNGWAFWTFRNDSKNWVPLAELRR